jgi:hypothetical protein
MRRHGIIIATLVLTVGTTAQASPILDQSHYVSGDFAHIIELTQTLAQSFTVGISGTLVRFTAEIARVDNPIPVFGIDWELREPDSAGLPKGPLLASGTLAPADVPTTFRFVPIDLTPFSIPVSVGDRYVVVLSTLSEPTRPGGGLNPYAWLLGDEYPRGNEFVKFTFCCDWSGPQPFSLGFETFVEPVPEPSALMLFGLAVTARAIRVRRR